MPSSWIFLTGKKVNSNTLVCMSLLELKLLSSEYIPDYDSSLGFRIRGLRSGSKHAIVLFSGYWFPPFLILRNILLRIFVFRLLLSSTLDFSKWHFIRILFSLFLTFGNKLHRFFISRSLLVSEQIASCLNSFKSSLFPPEVYSSKSSLKSSKSTLKSSKVYFSICCLKSVQSSLNSPKSKYCSGGCFFLKDKEHLSDFPELLTLSLLNDDESRENQYMLSFEPGV